MFNSRRIAELEQNMHALIRIERKQADNILQMSKNNADLLKIVKSLRYRIDQLERQAKVDPW